MNSVRAMTIRRIFLAFALLLAAPPLARAAITHDYFGVYMQGGKVGFLHAAKDTGAKYANQLAVRSESTVQITLNVLGNVTKSVSRTVSYNHPKTGAPLFLAARSEASGRVSRVWATFTPRTVSYVADIQGTVRRATLALAPGESFLSDPSSGANPPAPKVGAVLSGKTFVPETLRLSNETVTVLRRETVPGATPASGFVIEDRAETGTVLLYVTAWYDTRRIVFPLGMEARREPKAVALRVPSDAQIGSRPDLAVTVGITPTGKTIDSPRDRAAASYRLRGASGDLPPSDNRQSVMVTGTGANRVAAITVTAIPLPGSSLPRFKTPADAPAGLRPYLSPTPYVSSGDAVFAQLAQYATGGETDIAKASGKIAAFVHGAIAPDSRIAALRTASDIEKDRRGVCREYTTFFAAIARSAGIPTRVCVGVVLVDGVFVFHAWPEVWVGDDRWVALEPTWGEPFADATHIKLAQGEITDLYRIAGDMGRYALEVAP